MSTTQPPRQRRKPPLVFKVIILVFFAIFGLVLAEVAVRITQPNLAGGPMLTRRDPYYGYWLVPNFDGNVTNSRGHRYHHHTNSLGHRAPEYAPAPSGHIICFGDSYTMAETVDFGKEYASILRDAVRPEGFEVVNFSRAGNGEGRWLKFLRRDLASYDPKLIVMQMCSNDFGDNEVEWLYQLDDDGSLKELPIKGPTAVDQIRDALESIPGIVHLRLYQFLKEQVRVRTGAQGFRHPESMDQPPEEIERENTLTVAILRAALEECRTRGIPVVWMEVGILPERLAVVRPVFEEFGAIELPIPSIKDRPDLYHTDDPHWNEAGQRFVADALMELITERGLLTPPSSTDSAPSSP